MRHPMTREGKDIAQLMAQLASQQRKRAEALDVNLAASPATVEEAERLAKAADAASQLFQDARALQFVQGAYQILDDLASQVRVAVMAGTALVPHGSARVVYRQDELELETPTVDVPFDEGPLPADGLVSVTPVNGESRAQVAVRYQLVAVRGGTATYAIQLAD